MTLNNYYYYYYYYYSSGRGRQMTARLVDDGIFLAIWVATSLETLEIAPAILHGDMLLLVGQ